MPNSLSDNSIFSIVHLRNGDTLVGTARGLDRLSAANFDVTHVRASAGTRSRGPAAARARTHRISRRHGLGGNRCRPRPIRSAQQPLARLSRSPSGRTGHSTALPDNRVQSLLIDSQGRLWVGLIRGLSWFDSATETFSSYHRDEAEAAFTARRLRRQSLFEDRGGSLWIGTKSGGLAKWNPRTWSFGHVRAERRGRLHRSQHHLVRRRQARPTRGSARSAAASTCSIAAPAG